MRIIEGVFNMCEIDKIGFGIDDVCVVCVDKEENFNKIVKVDILVKEFEEGEEVKEVESREIGIIEKFKVCSMVDEFKVIGEEFSGVMEKLFFDGI